MNKFQKQLAAIFAALGFTAKAKDGTLNDAEWQNVFSSYKEKYGTELQADLQANDTALAALEAERAQILGVVNTATATAEGNPIPEAIVVTEEGTPSAELSPVAGAIQKLFTTMQAKLDTMASRATPDLPVAAATMEFNPQGPGTNATHLFGIDSPMFALSTRWNAIAANPAFASINPVDEDGDGKAFKAELAKFGKSISGRYNQLQKDGKLDVKILTNFGVTTTGLADAGLGSQYIVRRQDALIARILQLKTVDVLFPVRYGIQDREMITNAFFTEVSQAYQEGEIWKGSMTLEPEYGHVDDGMAKFKFGSMKFIEKLYIGYLNTSGSDPIKWSMIEFMLLNMYIQMANEYNKRRIMGIYVSPESGVAGSYLNAGTGVFYTLIRYVHENKVLVHDDVALSTYDETDFVETAQDFVGDIRTSLSEDQNLDGFALYLNENHQTWWMKNIRTLYGKDIDFKGPGNYMTTVPDTSMPILWVPNLGQSKLMIVQTPGNIQGLGYVPGEMLSVKLKEDMELVKGWSTWKEGTSASYVGRKFADKAALVANAFKLQQIFMNKPAAAVAPDATTVDAAKNFWFVSGINTAAKALTDILNAAKGPAYIFECGDIAFPTTIAKAGKFSEITAAYTPTAVGDYIMVILASTGKFFEMERCIAGVRTINTALQPNIPGAR